MVKLIPESLKVDANDGFKNSIFPERKDFGERLRNLVVNHNSSLVISLDGKWGDGKTTFIKMWQGLLNESAVPNIYIDAFANDHVDDAFISIVSSITHYAEDKIPEKDFKDLKEKAKKVGAKFLSWSVRMGAKAATLGIIKNEDINLLTDIQKDLSKSVSDSLGDIIDERISSHAKDIQSVESFKDFLSELPVKLKENEAGRPLVIIIDELDRCKPTFAIEVLEKIKHLFLVENIIFLLVVNRAQLEISIKSVYGQGVHGQEFDASTYLQKFIHIEARIPKANKSHDVNDIKTYTGFLFEKHNLKRYTNDGILHIVNLIGNHLSLSLRDLEKIFIVMACYFIANQEENNNQDNVKRTMVVFLAILKVKYKDAFEKVFLQNISWSELDNLLMFPFQNTYNDQEKDKLITDHLTLRFFFEEEQTVSQLAGDVKLGGHVKSLYKYCSTKYIDKKSFAPEIAKKLIMFA
jgi:predicted KAP-like P-loop ATPase